MKDKLHLTKEEARNLVSGYLDGYVVIQDKITSQSRWSLMHRIVVQRLSDGKYFADSYSVGATETQMEDAFDYSEPSFIEVEPIEKKVIVYE